MKIPLRSGFFPYKHSYGVFQSRDCIGVQLRRKMLAATNKGHRYSGRFASYARALPLSEIDLPERSAGPFWLGLYGVETSHSMPSCLRYS